MGPLIDYGAIHLWGVRLDAGAIKRRQEWEPLLTEDELQRAQRFYFERDRHRFIMCRGGLRTILAKYCQCDPRELRFDYGPHGKPILLAPLLDESLYFNVSHSHDLALIGLQAGHELGVDVEHVREIHEMERIAQRYFTPREQAMLQQMPPSQRTLGFLRAWTRKEAMLKAIGVGLSFGLNEVEVTVDADGPARVLSIQGQPAEGKHAWRLEHVEPAPGFVAAVATQGDVAQVIDLQWVE